MNMMLCILTILLIKKKKKNRYYTTHEFIPHISFDTWYIILRDVQEGFYYNSIYLFLDINCICILGPCIFILKSKVFFSCNK